MMKRRFEIQIKIKKNIYATCDHIVLDPYAPSFNRVLYLKKVKVIKEIELSNTTLLTVLTRASNILGSRITSLYEFHISVLDFNIESNEEWMIKGFIQGRYAISYKQEEIDIFKRWRDHEPLDWFSLPLGSSLKGSYFTVCRIMEGLPTKMLEKETYCIDMGKIREEVDFYYLASIEFLGEYKYIGYEPYTFNDCMDEIFIKSGGPKSRKLVFLNAHNLYSDEIADFYNEVKNHYLACFDIEEK